MTLGEMARVTTVFLNLVIIGQIVTVLGVFWVGEPILQEASGHPGFHGAGVKSVEGDIPLEDCINVNGETPDMFGVHSYCLRGGSTVTVTVAAAGPEGSCPFKVEVFFRVGGRVPDDMFTPGGCETVDDGVERHDIALGTFVMDTSDECKFGGDDYKLDTTFRYYEFRIANRLPDGSSIGGTGDFTIVIPGERLRIHLVLGQVFVSAYASVGSTNCLPIHFEEGLGITTASVAAESEGNHAESTVSLVSEGTPSVWHIGGNTYVGGFFMSESYQEIWDTFTVIPGTSGLEAGDPVNLYLRVKGTGGISVADESISHTKFSIYALIRDDPQIGANRLCLGGSSCEEFAEQTTGTYDIDLVLPMRQDTPLSSPAKIGETLILALFARAENLINENVSADNIVHLDVTLSLCSDTPGIDLVFASGATFLGSCTEGDLELVSVEPVQTVFDPSALVEGKLTALKVKVKSTFPEGVPDVFRFKITHGNNIIVGETSSFCCPKVGTKFIPPEFFQFQSDPDPVSSFLNPLIPSGNDYMVTVELDPPDDEHPNGLIEESNETNNIISLDPIPVENTKPLGILYVPIDYGNFAEELPQGEMLYLKDINSDFIKGTYPVSEAEFHDDVGAPFDAILCDNEAPQGQLAFAEAQCIADSLEVFTWDLFSPFDRAVGVVQLGWFAAYTDCETVDWYPELDFSCPGGFAGEHTALFEPIDDAVTAHELGHTYGLPNYDEPVIADGYWVAKGGPVDGFDFMGPDDPNWISNDSFEVLLDAFMNPYDPPVIGIRGTVFKDGTVTLDPWYRFEDTLDIPLGSPGEFIVEYLDTDGNVIGQTGFDIDFRIADIDLVLDSESFALKIPDVENTARIVIKHADQILVERTITPNPPTVMVTSPNGGEFFEAGARVDVEWEGLDTDGDTLSYGVSISKDGGTTWIPLAIGVAESAFSFDVPEITTDSALIKVIATDGINTAEDVSDAAFSVDVLKGDSNDDGFIDVFDMIRIGQHIVQLSLLDETQFIASDISPAKNGENPTCGNGIVDVFDMIDTGQAVVSGNVSDFILARC